MHIKASACVIAVNNACDWTTDNHARDLAAVNHALLKQLSIMYMIRQLSIVSFIE